MNGLILISGALANKPFNGGNAWSRLSWIQGFKRLGFEVFFVEQISRESCVDANDARCDFEDSVNAAYFKALMRQFGLEGTSCLIGDNGASIHGAPLDELTARARGAELLFNMSGHLTQPELKCAPACKLFYDDDPGYTQFWNDAGNDKVRMEGHDFYFTLGANIGARDCVIPAGGVAWQHTRPPVVLDEWPAVPSSRFQVPISNSNDAANESFVRFTTVASWRGTYGPAEYQGKAYGLKVHEFRKFLSLPRRSGDEFEIALQIHPADEKDLNALLGNGWHLVDPRRVTSTPDEFRAYVQNSSAEFSVAQGVYVDTNSGWFSDRTVRYLASGHPALVQETGFSRHIPTGEGLLSFRTLDEAVEGAQRISADYERHCRAARRIAEEYFDSDKVIRQLLRETGVKLP